MRQVKKYLFLCICLCTPSNVFDFEVFLNGGVLFLKSILLLLSVRFELDLRSMLGMEFPFKLQALAQKFKSHPFRSSAIKPKLNYIQMFLHFTPRCKP